MKPIGRCNAGRAQSREKERPAVSAERKGNDHHVRLITRTGRCIGPRPEPALTQELRTSSCANCLKLLEYGRINNHGDRAGSSAS